MYGTDYDLHLQGDGTTYSVPSHYVTQSLEQTCTLGPLESFYGFVSGTGSGRFRVRDPT